MIIIGTGTMGSILVDRFSSYKACALSKDANKLKKKKLLEKSDIIVLAIKPQDFKKFALECKDFKFKKQVLILSVMAGVSINLIQKKLGVDRVVRTMPNLAAKIGKSIVVWKTSKTVSKSQKKQVKQVLKTLGTEVEVNREKYIDMATALSGSGPAYVFLFQEMLAKAGKEIGLPNNLAQELSIATLIGAAGLMKELSITPEKMRAMVTSKKGTTAAAIKVLQKNKTASIYAKALKAAYKRSLEIKKSI